MTAIDVGVIVHLCPNVRHSILGHHYYASTGIHGNDGLGLFSPETHCGHLGVAHISVGEHSQGSSKRARDHGVHMRVLIIADHWHGPTRYSLIFAVVHSLKPIQEFQFVDLVSQRPHRHIECVTKFLFRTGEHVQHVTLPGFGLP